MKIQSIKSLFPAQVTFEDGSSSLVLVDLSNKKVTSIQATFELDADLSESIVNKITKHDKKAISTNVALSQKILDNADAFKDKFNEVYVKSKEMRDKYGSQ